MKACATGLLCVWCRTTVARNARTTASRPTRRESHAGWAATSTRVRVLTSAPSASACRPTASGTPTMAAESSAYDHDASFPPLALALVLFVWCRGRLGVNVALARVGREVSTRSEELAKVGARAARVEAIGVYLLGEIGRKAVH